MRQALAFIWAAGRWSAANCFMNRKEPSRD
jgi:hypothetical protein